MPSSTKGAQELAEKLELMAERTAAPAPAFKVWGEWLRRKVDNGFERSTEWDGTPFAALAPATIDARIAERGGFKRKKSGGFTKGALKKQAKFSAPGGIKTLVDSGRARDEQRVVQARVGASDGILWTAVGYLEQHMTGTADIPRRNPTPFTRAGSSWTMADDASSELAGLLSAYILTGKAVT